MKRNKALLLQGLVVAAGSACLLSDQPILFLYLRFALLAAPFRLTLLICALPIRLLLPITILVLPGPAHALLLMSVRCPTP